MNTPTVPCGCRGYDTDDAGCQYPSVEAQLTQAMRQFDVLGMAKEINRLQMVVARQREALLNVKALVNRDIPAVDFTDKDYHSLWCELNHLLGIDIPYVVDVALAQEAPQP